MITDDVGGPDGLGSLLAPRAEMSSLLRAERLILERVARGAPLAEVLDLLCVAFQRHALGMCAIFLERGGRLYPAASGGMAPSLTEAFVDGIEIGPDGGACGNAAYRRQRFLVADVASDPCFQSSSRDALRCHGVVAATATPIISASGRLFGTFTVCHTRTFTPDADELGLIDRFVHLAGITIEREQVLAALRDSEAQHRSVVNALDEIIFHTDLDLRFTFVSAAVSRVVGYAVEEALGRPTLDFVHADDRAAAAARMRSLLELERESAEGELRIVGRDGGPRWVRMRARPKLDAGGQVIGLSGSISDITERKKLEAQLLVSDRMASMGTLVAGVAHEINNPLASMMLNLDFIVREIHHLADRAGEGRGRVERLLEPARAVAEGTERVRDIVKNLKIFSRGDERRGPVEIQPVLESTIRMAANEIRHRAEVVRAYGRVPVVEANEASLGQVFLNLIVNAAHAIPEGDAEYHKIEIRTFTDEKGNAVVEISDSGAGIAPEHLPRIFDPFFTTKPLGVGTGLGLSICHRLVTGLGGDISVESQRGVGSTFRVVLPGSTRSVPQRRTPSQPLPIHRRGTVLVVDDEPIVGAAVRRMLAPLHDVTYVTSGTEALAQLDGGARFDVILCDLMMPGMTGMQLYDEMRRRGADLAARVVFITGGAFTPRAKSFLETVPNLVLDKPFEFKVLAAAINELLRSVAPGPG